jgi:hypothetical protein
MSLSYAMTNVFFKSISNQVIGVLKGNWSLQRRQRLPLRNSSFAVAPSPSPSLGREQKDFVFGTILTHLFMTKGEESTSRALMIPFLAIHAKGGESMSPKQKDRTTTNFQFQKLVFPRIFSIGILLCSKGGESSVSKCYIKTLLNTKRRISFRGSFV